MRVQAGIVQGLFGAVPPAAARWSGCAVVQLSHLLLQREEVILALRAWRLVSLMSDTNIYLEDRMLSG